MGASECIFDLECISNENLILIPKLLEEWSRTPQILSKPNYDNFFEILFTLTSGDKLRIACDSLEIDLNAFTNITY